MIVWQRYRWNGTLVHLFLYWWPKHCSVETARVLREDKYHKYICEYLMHPQKCLYYFISVPVLCAQNNFISLTSHLWLWRNVDTFWTFPDAAASDWLMHNRCFFYNLSNWKSPFTPIRDNLMALDTCFASERSQLPSLFATSNRLRTLCTPTTTTV